MKPLPSGQLPRILLVDDQEINRVTLEAILSSGEYELHTAADGYAALDAAALYRPDLILLDIMMPELDGYAVCRQIRATPALASIPVVMVTALNDQDSRLKGIQAGADDFISKPIPIEELRARVRTITRLNRFRSIAEQRARFEHLFELSPAAIVLVDSAGQLCAVNARADDLLSATGLPPRIGCPLSTSLPAPAVAELAALTAAAFAGPNDPSVITVRLKAPNCDRVLHVRAARLDETDGPLVMLLLDDITVEVRAREAMEAMNRDLDALVRARTRQLEEANQLLMSYAAFVSHDLRSPLCVVKGYLSLLVTGPALLDPEVKSCITQAHAATLMMEDMITNILRLASDEHSASGPEHPIDPRPIIERLCWKLAAVQPKLRPIINILPLPPVLASEPLLERVFFNIVSNALKYSGGRSEPMIEIGAQESPTGPVLYVRDNGVGFDARDADRLFREFSRLPSAASSDGLGLGLSLVSRLLRAHQGRIWAEGRPGEGATFYVCFGPASTAAAKI
jgi:signal transduction histidine kinase/FixJ family two-component response regulator